MRSTKKAAHVATIFLAGMVAAGAEAASAPIVAKSGWRIDVPGGQVTVQALTPRILKLTFAGADGKAAVPSVVVDPRASFPVAPAQVSGQALSTDAMAATWDARTRLVHVEDAAHHALVDVDLAALAKGRLAVSHARGDDIYGIHGYDAFETADGGLRRQGKSMAKAGEQGYAGAPFAWSTSGYGVLADVEGAHFVVDAQHIRATARKGKTIGSIYVFVGNPKELFGALAQVSGATPLFPKWAMGFTNSQWGVDQTELLSIVDTYRTKQIPIDNITLDFDWKAWGEDHYGEFRWNDIKFPGGPTGELKRMLDAKGVHLTGIMKPRVHLDSEQGRYATDHGFWLAASKPAPDYFSHKTVRDVDFANPEARAWFFNDALRQSFDTGMVGWWNDEADTVDSDTQFLDMQRAMYDGQRAHSDLRVWSVNRNFYLGSQRYAYGLWSGDIFTGFDSMKAQRQRMLSAINVGAMQWGMDGGGFKHGTPTPENYARWIQFGAFTPIFRVHGDFGQKRQPWVYGPVAEQAAAKAIRLRYQLIPYIYAYEQVRRDTGVGIVRPLLVEWPDDVKLREDVDAWLFGDYLLAAPVVEQGQVRKAIYLPEGRWTDYATGKIYEGKQSIELAVDSKAWSDIPLFVREGAIIPMQPVMNYVGEHPVTSWQVEMFPASVASGFNLYDDDGKTYAYEGGAWRKQTITQQRTGSTISVQTSKAEGDYASETHTLELRLHGVEATSVTLDGVALPAKAWTTGSDRFGAVTRVEIPAWEAHRIVVETAR